MHGKGEIIVGTECGNESRQARENIYPLVGNVTGYKRS